MKIGIIGFGSIGTEVAKALIKGVEDFTLFGVSSRSHENALKRISSLKHNIKIYDLDELIENCDILLCKSVKICKNNFLSVLNIFLFFIL